MSTPTSDCAPFLVAAAAPVARDGALACAPSGTESFAAACALERRVGAGGLELTVRNPGGGFHRLLVTAAGRGVVAADGAEAAEVSIAGAGEIAVAIGGDRYRLPATTRAR
ncbi:hypothetical protein ACMT1E_11555 [Sphingomonas flavalba]|uniref:hypothetical protein n=1 Tax=Sphingomonas flavalba TaxID=2559804 RepID=UPI0039DF4CFF